MELKIRNVDPTNVNKWMIKRRNLINHDSSLLTNQVHTLAIFSQHSSPEEPPKNLLRDQLKKIGHCTTSMGKLKDMLKELIREFKDDE